MAKRARSKGLTTQQRKFQRAAKSCHSKLRAGDLPQKGNFRTCMRSEMKKR